MKFINSQPWLRSLHNLASHSEHSPLPALIAGSPQNIKHTKHQASCLGSYRLLCLADLLFPAQPPRLSSNAGTFWKTSLAVLNRIPFVPPEYPVLDSVISRVMHRGVMICLLSCLSRYPMSCGAARTLLLRIPRAPHSA